MRTVGIAVLGLVGGVLLAIIIQDLLARALVGGTGGDAALTLGPIQAALLPALGIAGAGLAVGVDRRQRTSGHQRDPD